ncbi:hypothetical protein G7018_22915 [Pseudomonas plecoglossicida]|nr:hypothetical protein [Pseudomonas plecoglossicida]MBA1324543.1 hypothetical protein [Pseudomonas plecoglossicida]
MSGGFKFSLLGSGIEASGTSANQVNETTWIERVEILEDLLLEHLDDSEYLIVFNELDEDYRDIADPTNHKKYTELLTSLFKAVQDVRSVFSGEYQLFPVVFLRDDIYDILTDPDRNKWNDLRVPVEWDESTIKSLLAFRISRANDSESNILDFGSAWNMLFSRTPVKYGHQQQKEMTMFKYITRSTQLRPRDYIKYIQACAEEAITTKSGNITPSIVTKIDKAFSNYLRSEIEDEISGIVPKVKNILNVFSIVRKQTLAISEFDTAYTHEFGDDPDMPTSDFILRVLFNFSVIGNQPSQINQHVFRYLTPEANLNRKEPIVLHRGLFKSLQII